MEERDEVIHQELQLIFSKYNMGEFDRTVDELQGLRYSANDFEQVEQEVTKRVLSETTIKEKDKDFEEVVQITIYSYYLMLHFTDMYLSNGDFMGLSDKTFEAIWKRIDIHDKSTIIEMALILEDTMVIVYGTYLLLSQVEREYGGR